MGIEDLIIRKNTIRQGGWFCAAPWSSQAGIILLTATAGSSELRTKSVFTNVRIEGNLVEGGSGPQLVVSSAKGIIVRDNRFVSPQHEAPPATGANYGIPKNAVVWMTKCEEITYEGNTIENLGSFASEPIQIGK